MNGYVAKENKGCLIFLAANLLLVTVLIAFTPMLWILIVIAILISSPLMILHFLAYLDFKDARYNVVSVEDNMLRQIDNEGNTIKTISLLEPHKVRIPYSVLFKALYRYEQGNTRIEFTSEMENAREVVIQKLRIHEEWPPVMRFSLYW